MKYSNPRREAMIEDWPFGRFTCRAWFQVETKKNKGERVARRTENKSRTGWNKPKTCIYARRVMIVDGDDGKTYILREYRSHIDVFGGDMKYSHAALWPDHEDYANAAEMLATTFAEDKAIAV